MPRTSKFRDLDSTAERELPRQRWKEAARQNTKDLHESENSQHKKSDFAASKSDPLPQSSSIDDGFVEVISSKLPTVQIVNKGNFARSITEDTRSNRRTKDEIRKHSIGDPNRKKSLGSPRQPRHKSINSLESPRQPKPEGQEKPSRGLRKSLTCPSLASPKSSKEDSAHLLDTRCGKWGGGGAMYEFQKNRSSVVKSWHELQKNKMKRSVLPFVEDKPCLLSMSLQSSDQWQHVARVWSRPANGSVSPQKVQRGQKLEKSSTGTNFFVTEQPDSDGNDDDSEEESEDELDKPHHKRPPTPIAEDVLTKLGNLRDARGYMGIARFKQQMNKVAFNARYKTKSSSMPPLAQRPPRQPTEQEDEDSPVEDIYPPTRHDSMDMACQFGRSCTSKRMTMQGFRNYLVDGWEKPSFLNVNRWGLGDDPLSTLSQSHKRNLRLMEHGSFRGNRLTNEGLQTLAQSLGASVRTLDFSENAFDGQGLEALTTCLKKECLDHETGCCLLLQINLSRNRLSDKIICKFCKALIIATPKLQGLGLADTRIGQQQCGGEALGELLTKHKELRTLDVHQNHFNGNGAYAFFSGLYQNGFEDPGTAGLSNGQLRSLDFSWNCLSCSQTWRIVRILGSTLRDNNKLFHLDLSFNRLSAEHCKVLADALLENHSLYGIHLVGNGAIVNPDGFVLPWEQDTAEGFDNWQYRTIGRTEQLEGEERRDRIDAYRSESRQKEQKSSPDQSGTKVIVKEASIRTEVTEIIHPEIPSRPVSQCSDRSENYNPREAPKQTDQSDTSTSLKIKKMTQPDLLPQRATEFQRLSRLMPNRKTKRESDAAKRLSQTQRRRTLKRHGACESIIDEYNRTVFGRCYAESPIFRVVPRKVKDPQVGRRLEPGVQAEWLRILAMSIRPELRTPIHVDSVALRRKSVEDGYKSIWDVSAEAQPVKEFGQLNRTEDGVYSGTPCCWICENWQEVTFVFTPGLSCAQEPDSVKHVGVFVAVDNFTRPLLLTRIQTDSGNPKKPNVRFEGVRMLPPTSMPMEVIFQVNNKIEVALDMDRCFLKDPVQILMHKFGEGSDNAVEKIVMEGEEENDWAMVTEVAEVNVIYVGEMVVEKRHRMRGVGTCVEDAEGLRCRPRMVLPTKLTVHIEKWTLAKSVFASHRDIPDALLDDAEDRCFWVDWRMVEQKFSKRKEAGGMNDVRDILREAYPVLRHVYKYYSTFDRGGGEIFAIWLNSFSRFCTAEGLMTLGVPRDAFDRLFITCKFLPNDFLLFVTAASGNGLIRFQFLEAMIRIADLVCGQEFAGDLAGAIRKVLNEYVLPSGTAYYDQYFRFRTALLCERIDGIYQQHIASLRTIYDFYAGKHQHRPEKVVPMIVSEFVEFLNNVDAWDACFERRTAPWAFSVGKAACPDEASTERHMELEFVEFLVSIGFVVFLKATGDDEESGMQLFPEILEEFFEDALAPHAEVVIEWSGSNIVAHLGGKLRGFDVSPEWLSTLASFLQGVFQLADDDLSGELSLREFRTAMQSQEVKQFLLNLGLEVPHLEQFFEEADLDGNGEVSLAEALIGFATMKERLKNDERALAFLRMIFERGEGLLTMTKEQFLESFGRPKVLERAKHIGIVGQLEEFWDFLAPKDGVLTVDDLLSGYLRFRDPHRGGDKAVAFLRELFEQVDDDGNGVLSKQEFMSILRKPKSLEKLKTLGMGFDTEEEAAEALLLFSYEFDVDFNGRITLEEMINGFMACRDNMRLRILEEAGYQRLGPPDLSSPRGLRGETREGGRRPRPAADDHSTHFEKHVTEKHVKLVH